MGTRSRWLTAVALSSLLALAGACAGGTSSQSGPVPDVANDVGRDLAYDFHMPFDLAALDAPDVRVVADKLGEDHPFADTLVLDESAFDALPDTASNLCAVAGGFGCPCTVGTDCNSALCVDAPQGMICSEDCISECPTLDFVCTFVANAGPDARTMCVPRTTMLCQPCRENADCAVMTAYQDLCLDSGDDGKFCGAQCGSGDTCPQGYSCQLVDVTNVGTVKQCRPDGGACVCNARSALRGLSTDCAITNQYGSCKGTRTCTADGLTACQASNPQPEICDGIDDDCDGVMLPDEMIDTDGDHLIDCLDDDDDNDGVPDVTDNCPKVPNSGQADLDGDHIGDACDPDQDGDGVRPPADCNDRDATIAPGLPEVCDGKDNNCDGVTDEGFPDSDGDHIADCVDPDRDGDTVLNEVDNCPDVPNLNQADFDGDHLGDACDPDKDGDGALATVDCNDLDPTVAPGRAEVCDGKDNDCDGLTDNLAADPCPVANQYGTCQGHWVCVGTTATCTGPSPGPEVCDGLDNDCNGTTDDGFTDTDHDHIADCVDTDDDNDGILDVNDNCPLVANHDQTDMDHDGVGDACDADVDGDGFFPPADCDDRDATVFPGNVEVCDGKDNDCDGLTDEGTCDDGLPCTQDVCAGANGCRHLPNDGACNDNNPCTQDRCDVVAGCVYTNIDGPCSDGDPCTTGDHCVNGGCVGTRQTGACCLADADCEDGNPCTLNRCDPTQHVCTSSYEALNGTACNLDGDGCTLEQCTSGQCVPVGPVTCAAADGPCVTNACVSAGPFTHDCVPTPALAGTTCDDGFFCTDGDSCDGQGNCAPGAARDCNAAVGACNTGTCDETNARCVAAPAPDGASCNADNNGCTVGDTCHGGHCQAGSAPSCDTASNTCNVGTCHSTGPLTYTCVGVPRAQGTACDDGLYCTVGETCDGQGSCQGGTPRDCQQGLGQCATATCDERQDACVEDAVPDGTPCDDGLECTLEDYCSNGLCVGTMDACVARQLNDFTQLNNIGAQKQVALADLGLGRWVAQWPAQASGAAADLALRIVDRELTKLGGEPNLMTSWPTACPGPTGACNCGSPMLLDQAVAGSATGDIVSVISARASRNVDTGAHDEVSTTLAFEVHDKDGNLKQDWRFLVDYAAGWDYYRMNYDYTCRDVSLGTYVSDGIRAVHFSDDSFGLMWVRGATTHYWPITAAYTAGSRVQWDLGGPSGGACVLPDDRLVVPYADATGNAQVKVYDRMGAPAAPFGPIAVSNTAAGQQSSPICGVWPNGRFVVAFVGNGDVYLQRFDSDGNQIGQTLRANQATNGAQTLAISELPILDTGNLAVTWSDEHGDSNGYGVKSRIFRSDFTPVTDEFKVNTGEAGNQTMGAALSVADDDYIVAYRSGDNPYDLFFRRINKDGTSDPGAPERAANRATLGNQQNADAGALAAGRSAIVWEDEKIDGDGFGVALRVFDGDGAPLTTTVQVNQNIFGNQQRPAVSGSTSPERIYATWTSYSAATGTDVFTRVFDASAHPLTDESFVNTTTADEQDSPDIAAWPDGHHVVVWTSYQSAAAGDEVMARLYDADGNPLGGEFVVNATPGGNQDRATVIIVDGAVPGFVVGWSTSGAGGTAGAYARKFDPQGAPLTGDVAVTQSGAPSFVTVAHWATPERYVYCWQDNGQLHCYTLDGQLARVGDLHIVDEAGGAQRPQVLFRDANRIWVVYDRTGYQNDAAHRAVLRRQFDWNWEENTLSAIVNFFAPDDQSDAFVAPLSTGYVLVGWTSRGQDGDGNGVYFRVLR